MPVLKAVTYQVEDAVTGDVLHRPVFTENYAEILCNKLKRKHPAAFVKRIDP